MDSPGLAGIEPNEWVLCHTCDLYYCKARYSQCPKCVKNTCDHCNNAKAAIRFGNTYAGLKLCGRCALAYIKTIELIPKD